MKENVRLTLPDSKNNFKAMAIKTLVVVHIQTKRTIKQKRVRTQSGYKTEVALQISGKKDGLNT